MLYVLKLKPFRFRHLMKSSIEKKSFISKENACGSKKILTCIRWVYYSDHAPCYNRMHNELQIENYNQLEKHSIGNNTITN